MKVIATAMRRWSVYIVRALVFLVAAQVIYSITTERGESIEADVKRVALCKAASGKAPSQEVVSTADLLQTADEVGVSGMNGTVQAAECSQGIYNDDQSGDVCCGALRLKTVGRNRTVIVLHALTGHEDHHCLLWNGNEGMNEGMSELKGKEHECHCGVQGPEQNSLV